MNTWSRAHAALFSPTWRASVASHPWIKVAHLAEGFDVPVCPHFLMELHVSLCAAVPNAAWVEYIPQLDDITTSRIRVEGGRAHAPDTPGLGIEWDWGVIASRQIADIRIAKP